MADILDTIFSYERELTVCSFLQNFSKGKGSGLQLICNAHTAFLLCGTDWVWGFQLFFLVGHIRANDSGADEQFMDILKKVVDSRAMKILETKSDPCFSLIPFLYQI